jgi:hypothetical protein
MNNSIVWTLILISLVPLNDPSPLFAVDGSGIREADNDMVEIVLTGKVKQVVRDSSEKNYISFLVDLELVIQNVGNRTAILFLDGMTHSAGEWLAVSEKDANNGKFNLVSQRWSSCEWSKQWVDLRRSLDKPQPPDDRVQLLTPGKSVNQEIQCGLLIPLKSYLNGTNEIVGWDIFQNYPVLWLKIDVQMWPTNIELPGSKCNPFGRKLQKRWRDQGYLWLDMLMSEPIELRLDQERNK